MDDPGTRGGPRIEEGGATSAPDRPSALAGWRRIATGRGLSQLAMWATVAICLCAAGILAGTIPGWAVVSMVGAGLGLYLLWPAVRRPPGAFAMHRGSAVIGPDIIGFGLLALFVALPVWIGRSEGAAGLHGSAPMIWMLLPAPLALLWVAAANACFWLVTGPKGLTIGRIRGGERIGWSDIAGWRPWRRGLPSGLRRIAPLLPPTAAGAVLLARDATGIELRLRNGGRRRLPREGFELALARVERALADLARPGERSAGRPDRKGGAW